jgi:hypothetical protein
MTEATDKLLYEISKKLNILLAISLRQLPTDGPPLHQKIQKIGETSRFLATAGLGANDIAKIVGAPVTSVRTLLTPGQKGKAKAK